MVSTYFAGKNCCGWHVWVVSTRFGFFWIVLVSPSFRLTQRMQRVFYRRNYTLWLKEAQLSLGNADRITYVRRPVSMTARRKRLLTTL